MIDQKIHSKLNRLTSAESKAFDSAFDIFCRTGKWTINWAEEERIMESLGLETSSPSWRIWR